MTMDDQIARDLDVVARVSRQRPISIAATLRSVGATPAVETVVDVAMARLYATRVARTATALYLIAAVIAIVVPLAFIDIARIEIEEDRVSLLFQLFDQSPIWFAFAVTPMAFVIRGVAWSWARRRFDGRRRVDGIERVSRTLSIASIVAVVMTFGLLQVALGHHSLNELRTPDVEWLERRGNIPAWWWTSRTWTLCAIGGSIVASIAGAIVVARYEWSWRVGLAGALLFAVTLFVGLRFDAGPENLAFSPSMLPSYGLRTVLAITGFTGLLAMAAAYTSARADLRRLRVAGGSEP